MSITFEKASADTEQPQPEVVGDDQEQPELGEDQEPEEPEEPEAKAGLRERIVERVAEWAPSRAAVGAHLDRARVRVADWAQTRNLDDDELLGKVADRQRDDRERKEAEARREIERLQHRIAEAESQAARETSEAGGNAAAAVRRASSALRGELAAAEARLQRATAAVAAAPQPSARDVRRARQVLRVQRCAALVAGVVGAEVVLPFMNPGWLVVSMPAAAVALWRLGLRADEAPDQAAAAAARAAFAQQGLPGQRAVAVDEVVDLLLGERGAAGPGTAPDGPVDAVPGDGVPATAETVEAFSGLVGPTTGLTPEELAAVARAAEDKVIGAKELLDHLVEAGLIGSGRERVLTQVMELRGDGPGWSAIVELPRGRKGSDAVGRIGEIASALGVKASRLQVSVDMSEEGHEGRFRLWVANADNPYGGPPIRSLLLDAARWDFMVDGVPLGGDARQVRSVLQLLWSSLMIGGLQRYGKSYLARLVAAAAALDPYVKIVLICGKNSADWLPLKKIAHAYVVGQTPQKVEEAYGVLVATMDELQKVGERMEQLAEADPHACPEGKITPKLAKDPEFGLTLLVIDELQNLLTTASTVRSGPRPNDPRYASMISDQIAMYNRLTPSSGGMSVAVVHRPGPDSPVTTDLRDSFVCRASVRVKGVDSARNVLGVPAVAAGAAPHLLLEQHKGVVVLDLGEDEGHSTIKTDTITIPEFHDICDRGLALRITEGTLSGAALELHRERQESAATAAARAAERAGHRRVLEAALAVMDASGVDRIRREPLAAGLAAAYPDRWPALAAAQLGELLRLAGVPGTVKIGAVDGAVNANGHTREQLQKALATLAS